MSDENQAPAPPPTSPAPVPAAPSASRGGFRIWGRLVLLFCLVVTVGYVGADAVRTISERNTTLALEQNAVSNCGLIVAPPKTLASRFTDVSGRLLADPPSSPDQLVDPDTLTIVHLDNSDEVPGPSWEDFEKHLAEATGKHVIDGGEYDGTPDQYVQISAGKITLLAIHAADTPFVVNNYGFQPVAVLGNASGTNGNHLDIIVPANSPISVPLQLKGHSLACTAPSSITGYRAAVATLMNNDQLRPNVDYFIVWSMGQKKSILGVAARSQPDAAAPADGKPPKPEFEAAAVSDEKLQSLLDDGKIDKSQFRMIYQSDVIPRTTIGYFYNLKPELAAKIREAILNYNPPGGADVLRFLPLDYKKDFQFVRDIDNSFDPRLDSKLSKTAKE
jgi:phosphonate transport system substrate-binding protein